MGGFVICIILLRLWGSSISGNSGSVNKLLWAKCSFSKHISWQISLYNDVLKGCKYENKISLWLNVKYKGNNITT